MNDTEVQRIAARLTEVMESFIGSVQSASADDYTRKSAAQACTAVLIQECGNLFSGIEPPWECYDPTTPEDIQQGFMVTGFRDRITKQPMTLKDVLGG